VQVVSSAIVDKYIGESARLIREMFAFARDHEPCIIFMDEIDAIGLYHFIANRLVVSLIKDFFTPFRW
jgi:ATP-dependent 26S proteasome regulatory subunit